MAHKRTTRYTVAVRAFLADWLDDNQPRPPEPITIRALEPGHGAAAEFARYRGHDYQERWMDNDAPNPVADRDRRLVIGADIVFLWPDDVPPATLDALNDPGVADSLEVVPVEVVA